MTKKLMVMMVLVAVTALAGCQRNKDRILFDGKFFRTKIGKVDGQRDVFTVTVRDVSQSPEGALSAGRFAGVSYCVKNYGSSDIDWAVGPDTPPEQLRIVDNTLVFQGTCPQ